MLDFLLGLFVVLHGLVHLWYVTLSQGLVEFRPEMGWTADSWLLSPLLPSSPSGALAGLLHGLATFGLVAAGIGLIADTSWWQALLWGAAPFSAAVIVLFWDGNVNMLVQKGLLGVIINGAIIIALLLNQ